jgi:cyclic pyranopterin monophosphate synthase
MTNGGFTHLDRRGHAHMVNITPKAVTCRRARAACRVVMCPETAAQLAEGFPAARDVLETARVAGIQAAKQTSELLPLCHPLLLQDIDIAFSVAEDHVVIGVEVGSADRTGVEMEALTAGAVAALTIYDMCKSSDPDLRIEGLCVWEKTGGRSGSWHREDSGTITHTGA